LFVVVFTVAAVFLLYEGATSGNYALIAVVLVAYVIVLMAEAYLSLRTRQQPTK
jgi:heme O synthase-like polyprenyltransferase